MKKIIFLISFVTLSGCTTYVEEVNNQQFKPLRPSFEEFERAEPSNGSIYSTSSSGLFSSDRRAKKVGDILSVTLSETFSSNKAVTNSSAKADVIGAEIGPTGILRNFAGLGGSAQKTNSFAGSMATNQSNSLSGTISATIVRVFPNGNLEIKGQKKLRITGKGSKTMNDKQIENFVMYYERITKHMLKTLPKTADTVISIDEKHRLKSIRFN